MLALHGLCAGFAEVRLCKGLLFTSQACAASAWALCWLCASWVQVLCSLCAASALALCYHRAGRPEERLRRLLACLRPHSYGTLVAARHAPEGATCWLCTQTRTRVHMVQGDLVVHLAEAAREELDKPVRDISRPRLQSLLELAIRTSSVAQVRARPFVRACTDEHFRNGHGCACMHFVQDDCVLRLHPLAGACAQACLSVHVRCVWVQARMCVHA